MAPGAVFSLAATSVLLQYACAEFADISNPPQDFSRIVIAPDCDVSFSGKVYTAPTWTIEPVPDGQQVQILTNPANLLSASVVDDALTFTWLENAFQPPPVAGVRIRVPVSQLKSLATETQGNFQVLAFSSTSTSGFTNITSISVDHKLDDSGMATMHASLPDLRVDQLSFRNSGGGRIDNQVLSRANLTWLNLISQRGIARYNMNLNSTSFNGYFQGQGIMAFDGSPQCSPNFQYSATFDLLYAPGRSCLCVDKPENVSCTVTRDNLTPRLLELTSTEAATQVCTIEPSGAPGQNLASIFCLGLTSLAAWILL